MKKILAIAVFLTAIITKPYLLQAQTANIADSLVLVNLYDSTNGPNWINKTGWLSGPVNGWYGITLDGNGRVITILLFSNGLTGQLPHSLGSLTNLQQIELDGNNFSGGIPVEIGNLTNLVSLNFTSNQLDGEIPASLGNLAKIQTLILYNNHLAGNIPLTLSDLDKLTYLDLSGNLLTGTIPQSFGRLKNLQTLDLFRNQLSGDIPDSLGFLPHLTDLELDRNQLTGPIPASFGNLAQLTDLWLNKNKLSSSIPAVFSNLPILASRLWDNYFTFDGMELFAQKHASAFYSPQDTILPIYFNNKKLSVSAGGSIINNTYTWYKDGALFATITGDSILELSDTGKYWVTVTNSVATGLTLYSDTFTVTAGILPITLQQFTGQLSHGTALLKWQTATERNVAYFNIQRSVDGVRFTTIGKKTAIGNSTNKQDYNYSDIVTNVNPTPTALFYRLQEIDKNGSINYSKIIRLANDETNVNSLTLYPNPAHDVIYIKTAFAVGPLVVTITNTDGKRILTQQVNQSYLGSAVMLNTSAFTAGTYLVQVQGHGKTLTTKFIKR